MFLFRLFYFICFSDSEPQSKVITRRIALLEKFLGDLCQGFGKVSRKNARLRDTGDSIASILIEYASKEQINTSSIQGLKNYAQYLSAVEDYRNAYVRFNCFNIEISDKKMKII